MQLIKHNKIRWDQTEKLIIDPFLDFNKRLNVQSLNKKFGKYFQKTMILKGLIKNELEFPRVTKKNNVESLGALVSGLGISKRCNTISCKFQGWS